MLRKLIQWVGLSGILSGILLAGFLGTTASAVPKAYVKPKSKKLKVSEPLFPSSRNEPAADLAPKLSDATDVPKTQKQA